MQALNQWLYLVSTALLAPVLVGLLALLAWTIVLLGGFARELASRGRIRAELRACVATATAEEGSAAGVWDRLTRIEQGLAGRLARLTAGRRTPRERVDKALVDVETEAARSLAGLSFCTRVAPMLGLMGTLIPLGPALNGLASGDVKELARNLVVAFTATVVGLLVGGATYGMGLARRTWYAADLADLEFLSARVAAEAR